MVRCKGKSLPFWIEDFGVVSYTWSLTFYGVTGTRWQMEPIWCNIGGSLSEQWLFWGSRRVKCGCSWQLEFTWGVLLVAKLWALPNCCRSVLCLIPACSSCRVLAHLCALCSAICRVLTSGFLICVCSEMLLTIHYLFTFWHFYSQELCFLDVIIMASDAFC